MSFTLIEGNEAIARGAADAGCRFFAGYPITPATSVMTAMMNILPSLGGICLQGEDEIASVGYCLGASMAGLKAMTATSGPGLSLFSEQISFAVGSEIPIVIAVIQRLGPSTGSATRGADGDIQFLRWGSSGGLPVIVLAPSDIKDCYTLTIHAFNLAETYRCPVFIASGKDIGMTSRSIDLNTFEKPPVLNRTGPPPDSAFLPFGVPDGGTVPHFLPIGGKTLVRQTSSTHGPDGYITTDAAIISKTLIRLRQKIETAVDRFSFYEEYPASGSDTMIIAYGVTARAAKAVFKARKAGRKSASLLILKTLWPPPERLIREKTRHVRRIIVPEMNLGQYVREIQRMLPDKQVDFLGRMDGALITPEQLQEMTDNG